MDPEKQKVHEDAWDAVLCSRCSRGCPDSFLASSRIVSSTIVFINEVGLLHKQENWQCVCVDSELPYTPEWTRQASDFPKGMGIVLQQVNTKLFCKPSALAGNMLKSKGGLGWRMQERSAIFPCGPKLHKSIFKLKALRLETDLQCLYLSRKLVFHSLFSFYI